MSSSEDAAGSGQKAASASSSVSYTFRRLLKPEIRITSSTTEFGRQIFIVPPAV